MLVAETFDTESTLRRTALGRSAAKYEQRVESKISMRHSQIGEHL